MTGDRQPPEGSSRSGGFTQANVSVTEDAGRAHSFNCVVTSEKDIWCTGDIRLEVVRRQQGRVHRSLWGARSQGAEQPSISLLPQDNRLPRDPVRPALHISLLGTYSSAGGIGMEIFRQAASPRKAQMRLFPQKPQISS